MTIDSLIQIIALIIAIYALVPRVRQLELRIKVGVFELVLGFVYFAFVLYLLFYDVFLYVGLAPKWTLDTIMGVTPSMASFPITLSFILFLWWRVRSNVLPRKSIYKFRELAEELLQRGEYSELISLLDRYWNSLIKIEHNQYFIQKIKNNVEKFLTKSSPERTLRDLLMSLSNDELNDLENDLKSLRIEENNLKTKLKTFFHHIFSSVAQLFLKILPNYELTSDVAGELIRTIFSKDDFVDSLSRTRPYFALELLKTDYFPEKKSFFEHYIKCLMRNPSSVFYYEISRIYDSPGKYDQEIPQSLRLIYFLLNDARDAEKSAIWSPIGDEVLYHLEYLSAKPDEDYYNFSINDFGGNDDKVLGSPIHLAIHFFDLMVGRALYQNVRWHMWLYYFPHIVDKIIENYKPHASVDLTAEWPTRYSYFIYLIIKVHEDWMEEVKRIIPNRLKDLLVKNTGNYHENDNIPKSSLIALGFSLEKILFSDAISVKLKDYLVGIVFRLYLELATTPLTEDYAKVLLSIFRSEGIFSTRDLKSKLKESFNRIDKIPFLMDTPEFAKEFS